MALAVTALGVSVGSRMRTFEGFGVISNFVVLPLYFLSGGVFPAEGMPSWMRAVLIVNPVSYAVDLMRASIGQVHVFPVAADVCPGGLRRGDGGDRAPDLPPRRRMNVRHAAKERFAAR